MKSMYVYQLQTMILQVPVSKVKFVCHGKQDTSLIALVIQLPTIGESGLPYRIYCFYSMKLVSQVEKKNP